MRFSLEELMTSVETDLARFRGRVETETEFFCHPNNFLVLDDQITVVGVELEEMETENGTIYGISGLQYVLFLGINRLSLERKKNWFI